jgi:hypothetical protein
VSAAVLRALAEGIRRTGRSFGLVLLLLGVNLVSAALLAVPLARTLEADLRHTDAAREMMHGFDFPWWSSWAAAQHGWTFSFAPDVFGVGFAFRNVDLLLRGYLPAGLFLAREPESAGGGGGTGEGGVGVDPVILALGAAYLVVQTFLAGGVLATLRGPRGTWTVRGLLHGSGFYFGRFLRLALLVLLVDLLLFQLNAPLARWADRRAREAVSEATAAAWLLGRHALLLLAILWINMVSGYAKAIVVLEERASAALALLSALSFALGRPLRAFGHYLALAALGVALLAVWHFLDSRWEAVGYASQVVTLVLAQALMAGRIALRLALWAGQIALLRRFGPAPWDAVPAP